MQDCDYMTLALKLASRGRGLVAPNPAVGAIIVKDGRIIGQGWHRQYGGLHAEREALADCTETPIGGTMYVTLEPCCHTGKQPPCTEAILERGIARVVVGSPDPNPLVAGKGIAILRQHGVEVTEGVCQAACDRENEAFFHFIRTGTPYVVAKYAMTADGKIATRTGASRWITGEAARENVHADRNRYSAILVGSGTVLADNPLLTCRLPGGRNPLRIVCDSRLRTPLTAQVVQTASDVPALLATCESDPARHAPYQKAGCKIEVFPAQDGHVDLRALVTRLGTRNVDSVLLEGGSTLHWAALDAGIVQRVQCYIAPKLFGGHTAPSPVGGFGVETPNTAFRLRNVTWRQLGEDFLMEGEVTECLPD